MVKAYKTAEGKWRARVALGGGKYKSFTRDTKKEAMAAAMEFEVEQPEGAGEYSDLTLGEAIEKYIEAKENVLSPATIKGYDSLSRTAFPELFPVKLRDLTNEKIQVAINLEATKVSPKTVANKYGLLTAVLKMFLPEKTFTVSLPQKKKREIKIPKEETIIELLRRVADTDMELPILLGAVCGLRRSEICGLRWSDVDIERGFFRVRTAKVSNKHNEVVEKGTKTSSGFRVIPFGASIADAFKRHYEPGAEFVTEFTPSGIYERYETIMSKITPEHYTLHELRHYACSTMIFAGVNERYIADRMGHKGVNMVRNVYGHIMEDKAEAMFAPWESYTEGIFEKSKKSTD